MNSSFCEFCGAETFNSYLCRKCSITKTGLDFIFDYEESKLFVKENGWDAYLEDFQNNFKELQLGSVSTYWLNDPHYIVKFRGGNGDLAGGWKGFHDHD